MDVTTTPVHLPTRALLRLDDADQTEALICLTGICWLTREKDPRDYILRAGEGLPVGLSGRVLVEALAPTELLLVSAPHPDVVLPPAV